MRRKLVVANWKMHGSQASVDALLTGLLTGLDSAGVEVAVCPSYVHIAQAVAHCANTAVVVGGQDCSHVDAGAYTGEVSPAMLADLGCSTVIVGHSERRQYHGESDDLVGAKLHAAVNAGLAPILCVGETRDQREAGEAEQVVAAQLRGALSGQPAVAGLVVAYEPVWAIGTGLTATPQQAEAMHGYLRQQLQQLELPADDIPLLYGGSVKPENAERLFAQENIDGALVGGAALDFDAFRAIIAAA